MRDRDAKDVTRRLGWRKLKPGDRLQAVRKAMGLRPGERIYRLCVIEVVSVRREPLSAITRDDCAREGFHGLYPADFAEMFCRHMGCRVDDEVTRIEFKRLFKNGDPYAPVVKILWPQ